MLNARTTLTGIALVIIFCAQQAAGAIIWYAAESPQSFGWSHLYSIDTDTKAVTDRGVINGQRYITDLAVADDGTLYAVGWSSETEQSASKLYKIIPGDAHTYAEWEIVTVKSNAMERTVNAAVMHGGSMYVASSVGKLQKLNYDSAFDRWEVVRTGLMGFGAGGDLAFSRDGSELYVTLASGYLGRVNFDAASADFGKATIIGHSGYCELFGLAAAGDELYAFTNSSHRYASSDLVRLDTLTGAAFDPVPLGSVVWGAAIPEPATMAMLVAGGLALLLRRRDGAHQ